MKVYLRKDNEVSFHAERVFFFSDSVEFADKDGNVFKAVKPSEIASIDEEREHVKIMEYKDVNETHIQSKSGIVASVKGTANAMAFIRDLKVTFSAC